VSTNFSGLLDVRALRFAVRRERLPVIVARNARDVDQQPLRIGLNAGARSKGEMIGLQFRS